VRGRPVSCGKPKTADFVLCSQHIPVAMMEAKETKFSAAHGMQQALHCAASLQTPFVFAGDGKGCVFHEPTGLIVTGKAEPTLRTSSRAMA